MTSPVAPEAYNIEKSATFIWISGGSTQYFYTTSDVLHGPFKASNVVLRQLPIYGPILEAVRALHICLPPKTIWTIVLTGQMKNLCYTVYQQTDGFIYLAQ